MSGELQNPWPATHASVDVIAGQCGFLAILKTIHHVRGGGLVLNPGGWKYQARALPKSLWSLLHNNLSDAPVILITAIMLADYLGFAELADM